MERLQKFLARQGVASRRKAEEMILAGKVKVNGKTVTVLGSRVDPQKDKVEIEGRQLKKSPSPAVYFMLNKPRGYISSLADPKGRKTVADLIQAIPERVYPVGRLDYDSEGLLLLTNDGDLTLALTHPSHQVRKIYRVRVQGLPNARKLARLETGVPLKDGLTAPATVRFVDLLKGNALLEISIQEGRNRQIRRMCEYIGHPVLRLKRIRIGNLALGNLKSGEYRALTAKELKLLKAAKGTREQSD